MARTKPAVASRKRRKKILKQAKGFQGGRRKLLRSATEALHRAWAYSYRDRKNVKRTFRRLWISRISAAAKINGISYSRFIHALSTSSIELNRKVLSEIAVRRPEDFAQLVEKVKAGA